MRGARLRGAFLIVAAAAPACTLPDFSAPPPRRAIETELAVFEWPERYAHWHAPVAARLKASQIHRRLAAWPREPGPKPRLVVCRDPGEAAREIAARGLHGDPRAPRTFPALRLALVPLTRDDPLLAELGFPPDTLWHSLQHEWSHLQAAGRPGFADAPLWFQEGLAEAGNLQDAAAWAATWPIPGPAGKPAEILHQIWGFWAALAGARGPPRAPWEWAESLDAEAARRALDEARAERIRGGVAPPAGDPAASLFRWRGRDAHADDAAGLYLAAALPRQVVEVDMPALAPGQSRSLGLRLGAGGDPDGGLMLQPAVGPALRLRCDAVGGLAAWEEDPLRPTRSDAGDRAAAAAPPGAPPERAVLLEHRGAELVIVAAGGFAARFPIAAAARAYPVRLTLYARDGVCAARARP